MRHLPSFVWLVLVVFATFAVHEAAHGIAGAVLGYDMAVRLNGANAVDATGITPFQRDVISAAGPAITLLQGLAAAALASATGWAAAFHVALAAFWMRVLAAAASLRAPNDEARLGLSWDLGYWTMHVVVIGALALLALWAARSTQATWRGGVLASIAIVVGMTLVVVLERRFPEIVIGALR